VLGQMAAGASIDDLLADHPYLEREEVLAALEYVARRPRARTGGGSIDGVKLLLDADLSPEVVRLLKSAGTCRDLRRRHWAAECA